MIHKISNLFWLSWIKKYENNTHFFKFLIIFFSIVSILLIWLIIWIFPFIYLGIIFKRHIILQKLKKKIWYYGNKSKFLKYLITFVLIFIFIMICCMIFPIFLFSFMLIGSFIESKKNPNRKSLSIMPNVDYETDNDKYSSIITRSRLRL